jgi:hypothetical protein
MSNISRGTDPIHMVSKQVVTLDIKSIYFQQAVKNKEDVPTVFKGDFY